STHMLTLCSSLLMFFVSHHVAASARSFSTYCHLTTSTPFPYTTLFRSMSSSAIRYWPPALFTSPSMRPCSKSTASIVVVTMVSSDRKSTRLNSSHGSISYAVCCLKKKNIGRAVFCCCDYARSVRDRQGC